MIFGCGRKETTEKRDTFYWRRNEFNDCYGGSNLSRPTETAKIWWRASSFMGRISRNCFIKGIIGIIFYFMEKNPIKFWLKQKSWLYLFSQQFIDVQCRSTNSGQCSYSNSIIFGNQDQFSHSWLRFKHSKGKCRIHQKCKEA